MTAHTRDVLSEYVPPAFVLSRAATFVLALVLGWGGMA